MSHSKSNSEHHLLNLNKPEDIKKLSITLNQYLRKHGLENSKQSLILEGISQALGFNTWNSLRGSLNKNSQYQQPSWDKMTWDVEYGNYCYNYQYAILRISQMTSHQKQYHYFNMSLSFIEELITSFDFVIHLQENKKDNNIYDESYVRFVSLLHNNKHKSETNMYDQAYSTRIKKEGDITCRIEFDDEPWIAIEKPDLSLQFYHDFQTPYQALLAISQKVPGKGRPRNLSSLKQIQTLEELITFMNEDPHDRVLMSTDDLGPYDWTDYGFSTRTDDSCYVIFSMKAFDANTITDMVMAHRSHGYEDGPRTGEIAVLGKENIRTRFGRKLPGEISKILNQVDNGVKGLPLSGVLYEGTWVISSHPEAKSSEEIGAYISDSQHRPDDENSDFY